MNQRRIFKIVCLCFVMVGWLVPVQARSPTLFSYSLDSTSAKQGEMVRLKVTAYKTEDTVAGFRLKVYYDEDDLQYVSTETSGAIKSGTMHTNCSSGVIKSVYVCNPEKGYAPKLSGTVVSFLFQVESDAKKGSTALTVSADQMCDYDGNSLDADNTEEKLHLTIFPAPSSKAYLLELIPSDGILIPEFSPSVHTYRLRVGSDVDTVTFQTDVADYGTARVSRKSLYRAGTETPITITVTSEDKTQMSQYLIQVQRAEKQAAAPSDMAASSMDSCAQAVSEDSNSSRTDSSTSGGIRKENNRNRQEPPTAGQASYTTGQVSYSYTQYNNATQNEPVQQNQGEDRTLVLVGDRMPSFVTGMLAAVLCITIGIAISLWLPIRFQR